MIFRLRFRMELQQRWLGPPAAENLPLRTFLQGFIRLKAEQSP